MVDSEITHELFIMFIYLFIWQSFPESLSDTVLGSEDTKIEKIVSVLKLHIVQGETV
jgi:hypothetical protein